MTSFLKTHSLLKTFTLLLFLTISISSCYNANPDRTTNLAQLKIATMQCKEPWILSEGNTLEVKVTNYLKNRDISLEGFKNITPNNVSVCSACEICPGPSIIITVDRKHVDQLLEEGFSLVND